MDTLMPRRVWAEAIPPIPSSRLELIAEDDGVLMWVRQGTLTVRSDGSTYVARAGEAVWVPPGHAHRALLDEDSVALPIIIELDETPPPLSVICVLPVTPSWQDWLAYRLSRRFGFASGAAADGVALVELLARTAPRHDVPTSALPPMPRTAEARSVIERLIRDPADEADLAQLAASALVSPRTLQRHLREQTGCSLVQWRTAIRIAAAIDHLSQGRSAEWTAHRVGYASASGFAHAFTSSVGVTPGRYVDRPNDVARSDEDSPRVYSNTVTTTAPSIPASAPSVSIAPHDSVLWVFRGHVTVVSAGRTWQLERGDVIWLPPGVSRVTESTDGSVVLPLGFRESGRPLRLEPARVVRMPQTEAAESFLLHTVVANHFLLRPTGHDDQAFLELLRSVAPTQSTALPAHVDEVVHAVIRDPSDGRTIDAWAHELAVAATTLRRDFTRMIGESFPSWRAKARMIEARSLMWDGERPSAVARRVGYAHLPAFSRAFAAAHGMPPREWQRREEA